jgi:hypothetical protein
VIWAWHRGIPSHVCCLTLFIDDLVQAFDTACAGVPLPVPDDADALLARRLVPLLFADDFNALADEPQVLQQAVDATQWHA